MFEPTVRESKLGQLVAGLVIFGVVSILLAILVQVNLLPGEILLFVFGPGFMLAALVFPEGIHSDSPVMFALLGVTGTAGWWWLLGRGVVLALTFWRKRFGTREK